MDTFSKSHEANMKYGIPKKEAIDQIAELKDELDNAQQMIVVLTKQLDQKDTEWEKRLADAVEVMAEGKDKDCEEKIAKARKDEYERVIKSLSDGLAMDIDFFRESCVAPDEI